MSLSFLLSKLGSFFGAQFFTVFWEVFGKNFAKKILLIFVCLHIPMVCLGYQFQTTAVLSNVGTPTHQLAQWVSNMFQKKSMPLSVLSKLQQRISWAMSSIKRERHRCLWTVSDTYPSSVNLSNIHLYIHAWQTSGTLDRCLWYWVREDGIDRIQDIMSVRNILCPIIRNSIFIFKHEVHEVLAKKNKSLSTWYQKINKNSIWDKGSQCFYTSQLQCPEYSVSANKFTKSPFSMAVSVPSISW